VRRNLRLFALATLGTIALASSKEMSARSWLEQVPPIPNDAETAYRQWVDQDGSLKPGNEFKAVENGLLNVAKDQSAAALTSPQAQQQIAAAEQLKQQFGSPEGQAKLRAMSAEQLKFPWRPSICPNFKHSSNR